MSVLPQPGVVSFARGVPTPDLFPIEELAECAARVVREHGRVALNYGDPAGYAPLRVTVGDRHGVEAGRVLLTPGSLLGLRIAAQLLMAARGRRVLVEAPTYDRMLHLLGDLGAEVVVVERGADGLDLDALARVASAEPRPAFLYTLPTFHNPTGRTLDVAAREALADVVAEHALPVLEDDPYGLLRFEGEASPSLNALLRWRGAGRLAAFASSFSKSVAPGLRVGYLILPEHLVADATALALRLYVSPPLLPQAQLNAFLEAGLLDPHLVRASAAMRERRDALLDGLAADLPEARAVRPDGGYFAWLELPAPLDADDLAARAPAAGVAFVPGSSFFADGRRGGAARLAYSFPSPAEIRDGTARLGALVREALNATPV
jgi:2-aminoadipate transaminase